MTTFFRQFLKSERSTGILLLCATSLALAMANTPLSDIYHHVIHGKFFGSSLEFWINDGLMTFFFLLVGLEIKRELLVGELRNPRQALLPILAALGGMLIPALFHFFLNEGTPNQSGWGIPMATDIAFSLGILSLLGSRVPVALKIFLTAFAIIDDLGAILVIALFYSTNIQWIYIGLAVALFLFLLFLQRRKVRKLRVYYSVGLLMWVALEMSGIHATLAGVLLAICIPFGFGGRLSPNTRATHQIHRLVMLSILPLFAFANTGIEIPISWSADLLSPGSLGISLGLVLGKPLGIVLFSLLGIAFGWCSLPRDCRLSDLIGVGFLGGIGFTMSIFIALLAFGEPAFIDSAKIAILVGSLLSGLVGTLILSFSLKKNQIPKS